MIRWLVGEDGPDRTLKTVLVVAGLIVALLATYVVYH